MGTRYSLGSRLLLFTCLHAAAALSLAGAQDDGDFSGRWILSPAASDVSALSGNVEQLLRIEQSAGTIHCFGGANDIQREVCFHHADGRPARREMNGMTFNSLTKWEGAALLININVSSSADTYSVAERWSLSRDGNRLTLTRRITRRSGDAEGKLVYQREGTSPLQEPATNLHPVTESAPTPPVLRRQEEIPQAPQDFLVPSGTRVPLRLMNSVSTKHSQAGDRVYLQTVYPVLSHGRIVIPPGSYVTGSLTEVKRAGRVKGTSDLFVRFDSLTLPNGVTRDFRSRMAANDGASKDNFDPKEGTIHGSGGKGSDAKTVAGTTAAGTSIGAIAGSAAGHVGMGAGIGAAAGAAAGLVGVLASRGPDATLPQGSTIEMVLDRDLSFSVAELDNR